MASSPEDSISDPLLQPDRGPRDAVGRPVRAPLGNSIKTFLIFVVLIALGVGIWWIRRPQDLSSEIGGRQWTITSVDGEPATNAAGTTSTFVLDGNGEVRAPDGCNVASGRWEYDEKGSSLEIEWETSTTLACPEDWPRTYRPRSGDVSVDGSVMTVTTATGEMRAVSLADHGTASVDELAGTWMSGDRVVEIGPRGLFEIDGCEGSWEGLEDDDPMEVEFDELQRDDCELAAMWREETPVIPVVDDDVLYLHRERGIYPIDRAIVRLDPVP